MYTDVDCFHTFTVLGDAMCTNCAQIELRSGIFQANLEKEVEREKALAEAEGRIRENRQNEDVNRRAMQLGLEEERKKLVEAINTTFTNVGAGTFALLTDKERLGTAVAGLTVLALGVYSAREGTRVAGQVFSRYALQMLVRCIQNALLECVVPCYVVEARIMYFGPQPAALFANL